MAVLTMCTYAKSHPDQMYSLPTVECTLLLVMYDTISEASQIQLIEGSEALIDAWTERNAAYYPGEMNRVMAACKSTSIICLNLVLP